MTTTRALYESLSFIASTWPKDKLRPDVNFGQSILKAAEKCLTNPDVPLAAPPPQTSSTAGVPTRIDSKSLSYRELPKQEERMVQDAIKALAAIKSGDISKKYPMPQSLARPASNPEYYIKLGNLLDSAAKGEQASLTFNQRVRVFFGMRP
ncbi:hypothetical protein CBS101457_004281 [Exobasidium rhododendri]|nr:hypothetical protein CBS101457_004281 [Exobasidium rhododendri]